MMKQEIEALTLNDWSCQFADLFSKINQIKSKEKLLLMFPKPELLCWPLEFDECDKCINAVCFPSKDAAISLLDLFLD